MSTAAPSPDELRQAEDVLRRLHLSLSSDNGDDSAAFDEGVDSLADAAFTVFGRRFKKKLFGEKDVVEFLKQQTEHNKLLRRLERIHDIVQETHAANVEDARGTGINAMREGRTADVNAAAHGNGGGLAALTTQKSLAILANDVDMRLLLTADSSIATEDSTKTVASQNGHYQASLMPSKSPPEAVADLGGTGRSRGRKAKFQTSRIRGMYDEDAVAASSSGYGNEAENEGADGSKSCRRRGIVRFDPREGAVAESLVNTSSEKLYDPDKNAAHAGLWHCYVQDDEDGKSRACAHRTVVDLAGSLENLGRPLALDGASREFPCTYVIGARKQHWAYLGGAVKCLCGETAISVKLSVAVLLGTGSGTTRLLTDGSTSGAALEEEKFAPPQGEFYRHCNVCKSEYLTLHTFYHQLCPRCGDFNYYKRLQTGDLNGYVCVVTGGRVRIGQQIALKLLRAGATVIVTTRFVHDASVRYSLESDYDSFKERLCIEALEMTDLATVEGYCAHLIARYPRIHVLINNAAQTITRTPDWHSQMSKLEHTSSLLLPAPETLLKSAWNAASSKLLMPQSSEDATNQPVSTPSSLAVTHLQGDAGQGPTQVLDESGQPIDNSTSNSWSRRLAEVSTQEVAQTLAVNSLSPFILCAKLKEALRPQDVNSGEPWGHIVNVSSLEGKFNVGKKSTGHPHTNMAKAALNMMTLTSAREFARAGILMNSVDTGWITDMAPGNVGNSSRARETFIGPPLDEVDGAARVLDPVFVHVNTGGKERTHGQFLKDYLRASW